MPSSLVGSFECVGVCRGVSFFSTPPMSQGDKMLFWKQKYMEPLETSYDAVEDI